MVIPLYNQCTSIQRTLDSVLRQDFPEFEVIVVDDGSTDGGGAIAAECGDDRVRLVTQANGGVSAARNRGVKEARGSIVAFLDADDEWYPDFLSEVDALAGTFVECDVFATSYVMRDSSGREQQPLRRRFTSGNSAFHFTNYFEAAGVSSPPIWSGAIAVTRRALNAIGGFPEGIASGEDLLTWARLFARNGVAYSPLPKAVYCKRSLSWKHDNRVPDAGDPVGAGLQALLDDQAIDGRKKWGLRRYIGLWKKIRASHWIAIGNRREALRAVMESLSYHPWNLKVWLYIPFAFMPSGMRDFLVMVVESWVDSSKGRI